MAKAKTHQFRAETRKVLNILTHSLYTNREIFLRELLSNASDALEKARFLQNKGESVRDADLPLEIRITADKEADMLIVTDTGVGMTEQEMIDNLGTIAKSGSEQFLREREAERADGEDARDKTAEAAERASEDEAPTDESDAKENEGGRSDATQIIGHFGVGFYSVFMVADLSLIHI